jgi:nucleotide-binding universal stress UspA family protein
MRKIQKILFPYDLSENALKVLPYALSLSKKYDGEIHVLYVEDVHVWGGHYVPHPSMEVFLEEAREAAQRALDKFCDEQLLACPYFQKKTVSGDPANEILKMIESEDIDLVVMGTHGRRGIKYRVFGSVAETVVKKSPVPVLVVNPHNLV